MVSFDVFKILSYRRKILSKQLSVLDLQPIGKKAESICFIYIVKVKNFYHETVDSPISKLMKRVAAKEKAVMARRCSDER